MNPKDYPCEVCRVPAGTSCKNYKGQNKQSCPDRGKPKPAAEVEAVKRAEEQPELF